MGEAIQALKDCDKDVTAASALLSQKAEAGDKPPAEAERV